MINDVPSWGNEPARKEAEAWVLAWTNNHYSLECKTVEEYLYRECQTDDDQRMFYAMVETYIAAHAIGIKHERKRRIFYDVLETKNP